MRVLENITKFRVMSVNSLMLLVTTFIVTFDNNALWSSFWRALGDNPFSHFVFVVSFVMFIMLLTLLLLSLFSSARLIKPATIIFIIISSIIAYFIDNMHVMFSVSMLQNVLETNLREASELLNIEFLKQVIIYGVLPSILIGFVKIKKNDKFHEVISRVKLLSVSILILMLSMFWSYKDYTYVLRENSVLKYFVNPIFPVVSLYKYIRIQSKSEDKIVSPVFNDAVKMHNVGIKAKKDILIIVVGETARAESFSLNGYDKNTNPLLQKESIVNYSNTISCGTATAESVPCMFSDLTKDYFSVAKAKQRENLLDGFKHAGFDVLWRDNNSSCKGVCARIQTESLLDFQIKDLCNDYGCFDEILLYKLDQYVNNLQHDAVIVLHQMGSHGPSYYKRYPDKFSRFTPECNESSVHSCKQEDVINAYDNTILYTDYFLSKVIDFLKVRTEKFNTAMIYISDHGESLGESGVYLHGLPYFMAPEQQTHVPFITWLSGSMLKKNNIDIQCLKNNSNKAYSHDNLVHSALGLMNVITSRYDKSKDVFSECSQPIMESRTASELVTSL